jgi:tRNA (cmo5U34)-methyltransferase
MDFTRYDRIVEHYPAMWPLLVPGYAPILGTMLDVVLARSRRPRELLDLGCGTGAATLAVAPGCDPEAGVMLVDGSAPMLRAAQSLVQAHVRGAVTGDFTQPAVAHLAFGAERYDLVLCSFALHHLTDGDKRHVLDQVAASLVPGGLLLLADEVATDRPNGWDVIERIRARVIAASLAAGKIDPRFWTLETELAPARRLPFLPARVDDLTSWLARAGLAVSCPVSILGSALLVALKPE